MAALGAALIAASWTVPGFDVAYGSAGMHIGADAMTAAICLLVGVLAVERFVRRRLLVDLLAALAFGIVLVTQSALLLALPTLLHFEVVTPFGTWSSAAAALLAATLLLACAILPVDMRVGPRGAAGLAAATCAALAAIAGAFLAFQSRLPLAIEPALAPVGSTRVLFSGEPGALALQGVLALLLATTTLLLLRRGGARAGARVLQGWLAPALAVEALAAASYALFPTLYSDWADVGELLQLAFLGLLTAGVAAELRAAAGRLVELAVLQERRRLARDLHDGVAQELAFIAVELAEPWAVDHERLQVLRSAAERGLHESRRAIAALTLRPEAPLVQLLHEELDHVLRRAGAELSLAIPSDLHASPHQRETILRVAREAALNAVRHGHASLLDVRLEQERDGELRLLVTDNGEGFDVEEALRASRGFGLTSARERVAASGGDLTIDSAPGRATTLRARWPHADGEG